MSTKNPGSEPSREPTGPKKLDTGVKKGSLYEMLEMLGTVVEPETLESFRDKVSKILERKAAILAELREFLNQERIDCEELVRTLERNYFKIIGEAINNLVDEINITKLGLGLEAVEKFIEEIQNLLYFDPEQDEDLINKLEAELNQKNLYKLEIPLRFIAYCQLALILDGGDKLKKFKERVKAALESNNYEELRGLVKQILALKIMQIYPDRLIPFFSEKEAYKLKAEYRGLIEKAERQLGLST